MIKFLSSKQYGQQAALFGFAAAGIYLLMINVTLGHLEALSGLRPFDMRPGGYSPEQANALLNALGTEGRLYYLNRQIPLDLAYPALMALTLVAFLKWLGGLGVARLLVTLGIWVSIAAAVGDYIENAGIIMMILSWPNPSNILIWVTSAASIAKASLTSVAVVTVIIGLGNWLNNWACKKRVVRIRTVE